MSTVNDAGHSATLRRPEPVQTPADWLALIDEADQHAEFLQSYDLAFRALESHPDDVTLRYRAVLALARSGATHRAHELFRLYGLDRHGEEDIASLGARLAKDFALADRGSDRTAHAAVAARLYEDTFRRTEGFYPGINAATMWLLAGDTTRAHDLAHAVLRRCESAPTSGADAYYAHATRAEAALVLGDVETARAALAEAMVHGRDDWAAIATTRRQLQLVCEINGLDPRAIAALTPATVVHYTGHMIGRLVPQYERLVARSIAGLLASQTVGVAYGSLASGADILFAEELIRRRVELNVVLPCHEERFIAMSVARAGREWIQRFQACRDAAKTVLYASEDIVSSDDSGLSYASAVAMGLAITRARHLATAVEQLAVWDGQSRAGGTAGTEADMTSWRRAGLPVRVIDCPAAPGPTQPARQSGDRASIPRSIRAFLFGDVKGFSKLAEDQLPRFIHGVMRPIAGILDRYGDALLARNTWGDGVFLVFRDARSAAACALDVQEEIHGLDPSELGLPLGLGLRIGGHAGPVFEVIDPVLKQPAFLGSHITRTARIEPVTPEGEVYVTEQFAALLALEPGSDLRCEYVGHMPTAKGYGSLRMYVLKRAAG